MRRTGILLVHYKAKTKFCVFVCIHAHTQTKRPVASKFSTEILERVFEKDAKRFCEKSIGLFQNDFKNYFLGKRQIATFVIQIKVQLM